MKSLTTRLSKIIVYGRDIEDTAVLYTMGLGLKIVLQNVRYLEMEDAGGAKLVFYKVDSFAQMSKGYSPMLSYQVHGIETVVAEMLKHGAKQEGTITTAGNIKLALLQGINTSYLNPLN